jgi:hypothetical protein
MGGLLSLLSSRMATPRLIERDSGKEVLEPVSRRIGGTGWRRRDQEQERGAGGQLSSSIWSHPSCLIISRTTTGCLGCAQAM